MKKKLLIIDDDLDICFLLSKFFEGAGYEANYALDGNDGIQKLRETSPDVVLCDFRLPDADGFEMLKKIQILQPGVPVIIITGYSDVRTAVNVIKYGAYDYVTKPVLPEEIHSKVKDAVAAKEEKEEEPVIQVSRQAKVKKNAHVKAEKDGFVEGKSKASQQLGEYINLIGPTDMTVIIQGETGVGKEIAARRIHECSKRKEKPFFALDCGALPDDLAASELFGHKKGSFTGALTDKDGFFLKADGGTLFLDEIGNLSYEVQVQLLRVVQERVVRRVGETEPRKVDVRLLVATNEDLKLAAEQGDFREDLYHRLNEFAIQVPPLRNRGGDIMLFAEFFLSQANQDLEKEVQGFNTAAQAAFQSYSWPGNLREMRNVVKRAVLLCQDEAIDVKHLPHEISSPAPDLVDPPEGVGLKSAAERAEFNAILKALEENKYNKTKTAKALNVDRKTLYNKMKQYNIK